VDLSERCSLYFSVMSEKGVDVECEWCLRGGGGHEPGPDKASGPTYEVRESPELGRYLIAARDLGARELVFRAEPIVSGLQPGSVPLCLGCYRPFHSPSRLGDEQFRCPTCGWPLCSEDCVLSLRHQVRTNQTNINLNHERVFLNDTRSE
jgi:hypothetical protein